MRRAALLSIVCFVACGKSQPPTTTRPLLLSADAAAAAAASGFTFSGELISGAPTITPFDDGRAPTFVVRKVVLSTGALLSELESVSGDQVLHSLGTFYAFQWNTTGLADPQAGYQIEVQLDGVVVGSITVVVVASEGELSTVDTTHFAAVVAGAVVQVQAQVAACASVCAPKACNTFTCVLSNCTYRVQPDDTACDDKSLCTSSDVCKAGACVGKTVDCVDGSSCTTDSCDPKLGCVHQSVADGTACTLTGCLAATCTAGACQASGASCDDANGCTADACLGGGGCSHTPVTSCSQRLTVTTDVNAPGQVVMAGSDFQPGETVALQLDGQNVGNAMADNAGRFTFTGTFGLTAPSPSAPGTHGALATGQTGSVSTSYTALRVPTLFFEFQAGSGYTEFLKSEVFHPGAAGLQPGEHVFLTFPGQLVPANDLADSTGTVVDRFFDSRSLDAGTYDLSATDSSVSHWHSSLTFRVFDPVIRPIADALVGSSVTVVVDDLPPGRSFSALLTDPTQQPPFAHEFLVTFTSLPGATTFSLPIQATDPVGTWTFTWVDDALHSRSGTASFQVRPNGSQAPVFVAPLPTNPKRGDAVLLRGTLLGAAEVVTFSGCGASWGTLTASSGGVLNGSLSVPANATLGSCSLVATGDRGATATWTLRVLNEAAFTVQASPTSIGATQAVSVTGSGAVPDETVTLRLLTSGGVEVGQTPNLTVTASGTFSGSVSPALTTAAGVLTVQADRVLNSTVQGTATTTVTLGATLAISPQALQNGNTAHVTGSGFAPAETVVIAVDGTQATTTTARSDGTIVVDFTFTATGGNSHSVSGTGQGSSLAASVTVSGDITCTLVNVVTISGSADAGIDDGTGGPPDLGTTWQSPWRVAVVPGSSPLRLWVTDPGNHAIREIFAEAGPGAQTSLVSNQGLDGTPLDFGDVRGLALNGDVSSFITFVTDPTRKCERQQFSPGGGFYAYEGLCDGVTSSLVNPVDATLNLAVDYGYPNPHLFNGILDDGLGCVLEEAYNSETLVRRACRPMNSTVVLEALAADGNNDLFTNNWLTNPSGLPGGLMRIHGYQNSVAYPLTLSLLTPSANGVPLRATGITVGGDGWVYVADATANAVYRVDPTSGAVKLLAGGSAGAFADGTGCAATFSQPRGVAWALTSQGPALFVADTGNRRIRRLSLP